MAEDLTWLLGGLLGLLLGSFLNVVIYQLPKMLERQWAEELARAQAHHQHPHAAFEFNLLVPRSSCPHCGQMIQWQDNIPVLSYLWLKGRCRHCQQTISVRYPLVELSAGLLCAWSTYQFGLTLTGLAWAGFCLALLSLALIDWDTTLLPDDITLPLLWAGLISSASGWTGISLHQAVWGAIVGYLSLWSIYQAFKLLTGKEGMGYGDFKLLAALGAWLGWPTLIPLILVASVLGSVVGIAMKLRRSLREGMYVPFGPFLASAGMVMLIWGPSNAWQWLGMTR